MVNLAIAVLAVNALCLASVIALTRRDVVLVDEEGRPLERRSAWREQVVPQARPAEEAPV